MELRREVNAYRKEKSIGDSIEESKIIMKHNQIKFDLQVNNSLSDTFDNV